MHQEICEINQNKKKESRQKESEIINIGLRKGSDSKMQLVKDAMKLYRED